MTLTRVCNQDVSVGFVLCQPRAPVATARTFEAQLAIVEYESIIVAGFQAVMHIHTCVEEITIDAFLHLVDKKTGKRTREPPKFVRAGQVCICRIVCSGVICIERYDDYQQLGRFTLRGGGKTIAMGKVLKLVESA